MRRNIINEHALHFSIASLISPSRGIFIRIKKQYRHQIGFVSNRALISKSGGWRQAVRVHRITVVFFFGYGHFVIRQNSRQ